MPKKLSKPIPTKFDQVELDLIDRLDRRAKIGRSEIIRLSVWLLYLAAKDVPNEKIRAFLAQLQDDRDRVLDNMNPSGQEDKPPNADQRDNGAGPAHSIPA